MAIFQIQSLSERTLGLKPEVIRNVSLNRSILNEH